MASSDPNFRDQAPQFGESPRRSVNLLRPVLTAVTVSLLGLAVAAGSLAVSASHASEQDRSSRLVDTTRPDTSAAVAADPSLSAQQAAAQVVTLDARGTGAGGLQAFGTRGTTVNRTSVRVALDQALTSGTQASRSQALKKTSAQVSSSIALTAAQQREKQMDADIARVKAEAARIAEEKRKAEELLRQKMLAALRQSKAQSKGPSPSTNSSSSKSAGDDADETGPSSDQYSQDEISALLGDQGVCLPLAPGSFRVGAHFGQYGPWARYHTGQDFPAAYGTPVRAVSAGVVGSPVRAWWPGNNVVIHHAGGGSTLYAHMSSTVVSPGQMVSAGQVIGYVGSTGNSFGNHLHFEYYPRGTTPGDVYSASNPLAFLRSLGLPV